MSFIISTRAQNRELLQAEIEAYLTQLDDSEIWRDYFESSTGKILINILTGISELLLYKLEIRSLDSYLPTALSKNAAFLLAQMVGYNPNRKQHGSGKVRLKFRVPPPQSLVLPARFAFDTEPPLVTKDNIDIPAGTSELLVDVLQGEWKFKEFSQASKNLQGKNWEHLYLDEQKFQIDMTHLYVLVDNKPIQLVNRIEKLDSNSIIARTDYKGGVILLFGDGTFGYKLKSTSKVEVQYLKTLGLGGIQKSGESLGAYVLSSSVFDAHTHTVIQGGSDEDSLDKVKFVASRFFQTQGRAVTRYDYFAVIMGYAGVIHANVDRDVSNCCTIIVCAIRDKVLQLPMPDPKWTPAEISQLFDYLEDYKMLASRLIWVQPEGVFLNTVIELAVGPTFRMTPKIEQDIREYVIKEYCYKLQGQFYSTKVVDDVASHFPGVKRVYIREVNGHDNYPDIQLTFNQFFTPGEIAVTTRVEVPVTQ